jgi:Bacteriophage T4-like portal protein (Gp20)
MAKFTDYFKVVTPRSGVTTMTDNQGIGDQGVYANYTWYQRLVQGSASRITRYREYDMMDNDVEIARALDTIAEEVIGNDPNINTPIDLVIEEEKQKEVPSTVVMTLRAALRYWCSLHDWDNRLFKIARVTIKYGDCFFIRHQETQKWEYVHAKNVVAAIVDDHDLTEVRGWQIKRDVKVPNSPYNQPVGHFGSSNNENTEVYAADDVIWFSLNDDISDSAPFGESVLRAVYRAQKQKELLEDAIIIYRIQRAPERRVFYVDVGKMAPQRVQSYLEQIKNEIRQKKIPTYGGGTDQVDSVYNPHSMSEDFFFAQRPDGKGSRVETLPGGQGLGELTDLEYFQNKVFRGLRIPVSYMTEGSEGAQYNDGKVGVAYIQELRFALYVSRLQGYINRVLDKEFKRYLRMAGVHVDPTIFKIALPDPENFGLYRQQEMDSALLNTLSSATGVEGMSKRFAFKKYGQFTDEDLLVNERMLAEERGLDPDQLTRADMLKLYGPPQDEAGMGGDMGTGMTAGGLGSDMGFGVGEPLPGLEEPGTDAQAGGTAQPTGPSSTPSSTGAPPPV